MEKTLYVQIWSLKFFHDKEKPIKSSSAEIVKFLAISKNAITM
jgi:hypothetical protein